VRIRALLLSVASVAIPTTVDAATVEHGSHAVTAHGGLAVGKKVDNWLTGLREPAFAEGGVSYDYRLPYVAFSGVASISTLAFVTRAGVTGYVPIGPVEIGLGVRVGPAWAIDSKYIRGTGFHLEARLYVLGNVVANVDAGVECAYFIESFRARNISESHAAAFVLPLRALVRLRF
jgi:hypothetical protein